MSDYNNYRPSAKMMIVALAVMFIAALGICMIAVIDDNSSATIEEWNIGSPNASDIKASYDTQTKWLTITGTGAMMDWEPLSEPWLKYYNNIKYVEISDDITSIGNNAFCGVANLTIVTIGNDVSTIGKNAFELCANKLTDITIPASVTNIDTGAFSGCKSLKTCYILRDKTVSLTELGDEVFKGCNINLNILVAPNSLSEYRSNESWGTYASCILADLGQCTVDAIPDQTYTGDMIRPSVTVRSGDMIVDPSNYSVGWSANTNVGEGRIVLAGDGEYSGSLDIRFNIVPKVITADMIGSIDAVVYNGSSQEPTVTVKYGDITMTQGGDYDISYSDNVNAGTATVTVTGKGNYSGSVNVNFTINQKNVTVIADNMMKTYGEADPELTATVTGTIGTDTVAYTITRQSGEKIGTYKITPSGDKSQGNYSVTYYEGMFTIYSFKTYEVGKDTASNVIATFNTQNNELSISGSGPMMDWNISEAPWYSAYHGKISSITVYDGVTSIGSYAFYQCTEADTVSLGKNIATIGEGAFYGCAELLKIIIPAETVQIGDEAFAEITGINIVVSRDNTVSLTALGADVFSKGAGDVNIYVPSNSVSEYRAATNWSEYASYIFANFFTCTVDDVPDQTYTGSALTPSVTVKDGTKTLVEVTDYEVHYLYNIQAGTAYAVVVGAGNYNGFRIATFNIIAKNITADMVGKIGSVTYDGTAQEPDVTVIYGDMTLVKGTDYDMSYSDNRNVGTAAATVTGKGNYSGTVDLTFTITPKELIVSGTTVADKTYDGNTKAIATIGPVSGLVYGDDAVVSIKSSEFADKNVAIDDTQVAKKTVSIVYEITGEHKDNYTIANETLEAKISPKGVDVVNLRASDKIYDGTDAALAEYESLSGMIYGDDLKVSISYAYFNDKNAETDKSVGVEFTVTGADAVNYVLLYSLPKAAITPRDVTMTSSSASKTYDGTPLTNDNVTVTGDGFIDGEGAAFNVTGSQTDAGTSDNTFNYTLNDGTAASNYTITIVLGTLTVNKADSVITVTKTSSCPSGSYNVGASVTSGETITYEITDGADIATVDTCGNIAAKAVGKAVLKITSPATDNYNAGEKTVDITVYDHIQEIVAGTIPTKTQGGWTEGIICSECKHVLSEQTAIPATGSDEAVIQSEDSSAKYTVPASADVKTIAVELQDSKYKVELTEDSTNAVKNTTIEFSITESTEKANTYIADLKSNGSEFNGQMNITLPYDPSKGTPSVKWVEGSEKMSIVSVNETDKTITFTTTHNSTYEVEYQTASGGDDIGIWIAVAVLIVVVIGAVIYFFAKKR